MHVGGAGSEQGGRGVRDVADRVVGLKDSAVAI